MIYFICKQAGGTVVGRKARVLLRVAWDNSRQFAMPSVVFPGNNIWEVSAEIPYWWHLGSISNWLEICFINLEAPISCLLLSSHFMGNHQGCLEMSGVSQGTQRASAHINFCISQSRNPMAVHCKKCQVDMWRRGKMHLSSKKPNLLEVLSCNSKFHVNLTQIWVVSLIGWKFASSNQKHYPDLGCDTLSVWNFCAHFSDVISRRNLK